MFCNRILLVDDDVNLLAALKRQLDKDYEVVTMDKSPEALNLLAKKEMDFAVALVDYKMPTIDGIQFCSLAKELNPDMVCILLSGQLNTDSLFAAINVGRVSHVLGKPCSADRLKMTLNSLITKFNDEKGQKQIILDELRKVEQVINGFTATLHGTVQRIDQSNIDSLSALGLMVATKSSKLAAHGRMVGNLARAIGEELQLPRNDVATLGWSGAVHDIGQALAGKSEDCELEGEEYNEYLRMSYLAVSAINLSWPVADVIYSHRERLDGSGYPRGLRAAEIGLLSRIMGVADYLVSYAQQQETVSIYHMSQALEKLIEPKTKIFDCQVVNCCVKVMSREDFITKVQPLYC